MKTFLINIEEEKQQDYFGGSDKQKLRANDEKEAKEVMKHLLALPKKLSVKELAKLANVVTNDPAKTALAKTYLGV